MLAFLLLVPACFSVVSAPTGSEPASFVPVTAMGALAVLGCDTVLSGHVAVALDATARSPEVFAGAFLGFGCTIGEFF